MASVLQSASRESLSAATARLDAHIDATGASDLSRLAERPVRRARPARTRTRAAPRARRPGHARRVPHRPRRPAALRQGRAPGAGPRLGPRDARAGRATSDLLEALESLARNAAFGVAEKDGSLDRVEDELFRFGRILDREPELARLLSDSATPADKRVGLLHEVVGRRRSRTVTATLLEQTVRTQRSRNLDVAAEELSELAAARRDRYVAHVRTPVRMTGEQEQRLTDSLTRLYGRPISLQVELDPDLLGRPRRPRRRRADRRQRRGPRGHRAPHPPQLTPTFEGSR